MTSIVNYIGIGFPKCGTTWVNDIILQHPSVYNISFKEGWYFFDKPLHKFSTMPNTYLNSLEWYLSGFRGKNDNQIAGEFTPTYIYDYNGLTRIKENFPNIRILISIRNPIEMMYSQYHYMKNTIVDDIDKSLTNIYLNDDEKYSSFREMGYLYKYIENAYNIFDREQILLINFDDIKNEPNKVVKKIYEFLGIDSSFIPNISKKNEANSIKSNFLHVLVQKIYFLLKEIGLDGILYKYSIIHNLYTKINKTTKKNPTINKEEKELLLNYYKDDIEKLEQFLKRDLSLWKK